MLFVYEYLKNPVPVQAAVAAGYSKTTADAQSWAWVTSDRSKCPESYRHVWDAVYSARANRCERLKIDADWLLESAVDLYRKCMQEVPVLDRKGKPTGIYRFEASVACNVLTVIGKHVDVKAFEERIVVREEPADLFSQAVRRGLEKRNDLH